MKASSSVRARLREIQKRAEDELSQEKQRYEDAEEKKKKKLDDDDDDDDDDDYGHKESNMGMEVHASALTRNMSKTASRLEYFARNFGAIVDDRPAHEKVATVLGYAQAMAKHGGDTGDSGFNDDASDDFFLDVNYDDDYTDEEQETPDTGEEIDAFSESHEHELATNMDDDFTDEEWEEDPAQNKKASVTAYLQSQGFHIQRPRQKQASRQRPPAHQTKRASATGSITNYFANLGLLKHANDMGPVPPAGAEVPGQAPSPGGAPPPPMGPPPGQMGPPPPPPGPNPIEVAMALQAQGNLTPESLAQSAGISPQEAAAVIASMAGGTGTQPMGGPPQPPMTPPGAPPAGDPSGGPVPAGGMEVQASAEQIFQSVLRKYAGEEMSQANISGSTSQEEPWNNKVKVPSNPGREFLQSNEAAINFTAQQAKKPRDEAVQVWFENRVPYKRESGQGDGSGKMDEFIGDKTSAARINRMLRSVRHRPNPLS